MTLPINHPASYDGDSRDIPVPILMDNVSAVQLVNHPKATQFSRHLHRNAHTFEFRIR